MESKDFEHVDFIQFKWFNEPGKWNIKNNKLSVKTKCKADFWQGTWYNFHYTTGHVYGLDIKDDFSMSVCVQADFRALYDQAGLMIYIDEKHWLKAGVEFNDGLPMIGSVLTNQVSDWATGVYTGNPRKFWLRLTKVGNVVCVKYSSDSETWILLRLCSFPVSSSYFVGPMFCAPQSGDLAAEFSELKITIPGKDILHCN